MLRLMLGCLVAAALMLAGCGSGSDSSTTRTAAHADRTTATTPAETTTTPGSIKNTYARPTSPGAHPGAKIETLVVKDVKKGTGAELHAGDTGLFEFIAVNYATGKKLDDSWGKKKPYETPIERGVVIDGWAQGIPGMRVGGRRQLTIPPALGFTTNPDPKIRDNPMFFDVVLLGVIPAKPAGAQPPSEGGGASSITG